MFFNRRKPPQFDVLGQLPALRRYATTLTRHPHDAEDLVQDALVRAYARQEQFDPSRNLRSWLLSILHNAFVDGVRSRNAERRRVEQAADLVAPHFEPSQDHAVQLAGVLARFAELPEEQRAALHLVTIEGLSYADAAQVLDVPPGTLMSRIGRARETLRRLDAGGSERAAQRLRLVGGADDDAQ